MQRCLRRSAVKKNGCRGEDHGISEGAFMRRCVLLILVLMIVLLPSCRETAEPASGDEGSVYSNLADSEIQDQLKEELISHGISKSTVDAFLADVKDYNETIQNTTPVQKGYKSFDLSPVSYDDDAITELWNEKYPVFMGYNCRLTAFFLYKDFIRSESLSSDALPEDGEQSEMDMLFHLSPEKAENRFSEKDRALFNTLYSNIEIGSDTTPRECIDRIKSCWDKYGIRFDGSDNLELITVYAEEDYLELHLAPVHAGLLITENEKLYFLEKLSFIRPYQYSVFESREDLYTYLKNVFGEDKKFFIVMKNSESAE